MRSLLLAVWLSAFSVVPAMAATNISIGINLGAYPRLVAVPGYPVYYAPGVSSNYFFYDGLYWVLEGDNWYASSWYNGPWQIMDPFSVPYYVLQVPVRYYRHPPAYFRGWHANASPRWNEHYGRDWEQRRAGWNDRRGPRPSAAPLPNYQRQYSGNRYPRAEQQSALVGQNYRYQPRDTVVQQHYQQQGVVRAERGQQRQERVQEQRQEQRQERVQEQRQDRGQEQHQDRGQGQDRRGGNERGRER